MSAEQIPAWTPGDHAAFLQVQLAQLVESEDEDSLYLYATAIARNAAILRDQLEDDVSEELKQQLEKWK